MPHQLTTFGSKKRQAAIVRPKKIMRWLCVSSSMVTGAHAAFVRSNAPTRTFGTLASKTHRRLVDRSLPSSRLMRLTTSATTAEKATTEYDLVNKERGLDSYSPSEFEEEIYSWWERSGCFTPDAKQQPKTDDGENKKKPYVLPMPPPNVTGRLHMGHAIFVALQDVLARFHRMRGRPVLWLPGKTFQGRLLRLFLPNTSPVSDTTP